MTMSEKRVHVRPVEGGIVYHPETGLPIPAEGVELRMTTQLRRYLNRGELVVVEPQPKPKAAPKASKED